MSCRSAYWRTYYAEHREDKADYYAAFSVEIRERQKEYDAAHKKQIAAKNKAYYEAYKGERKAYREAHKEERKAWYEAHKDEINARRRARRAGREADLCVYSCGDCFYFGKAYEGAFYCAFDSEHTRPLDIDADCKCFMKQEDGRLAWLSVFDKPRHKAGI